MIDNQIFRHPNLQYEVAFERATHTLLLHMLHFRVLVSLSLNRKAELSDTSAVLEAFKFIENAAAEFSDEDDDEDSEGKDRTHVESRTVSEPVFPHLLPTHKVKQKFPLYY